MFDPHDDRLSLPIEPGVLLWCMRAWVLEMRRPSRLEPRIHDLLDRFGVPRVSFAMQRLMSTLSQEAARMIDVQCVCCTRIGADERALLEVLGLAQAIRPFEALLLLHGLVTPAGARAALECAEVVGTAMAEAGRFLPAPDQAVRRYALVGTAAAMARPSNAMLH